MTFMTDHSLLLLKQLLTTPGPAGDEIAVARVWRTEARTFADEVYGDVQGNSYAVLHGAGPRVLLAGHLDEIGLMVTFIDESGYLSIAPVGGWDAQVLVGQRVRLPGQRGAVVGVIGSKPVHLMSGEERASASKIENLWVDIGAQSREQAQEHVRVGDIGVIDGQPCDLLNRRIASRSFDDRIGAFVVLEVLRLLSQQRPAAHVVAVATVQEEIGHAGAGVAAYRVDPHVAIAVDVGFATDQPGVDKRRLGDVQLGGGPLLARGAANHPLVHQRLREIAEREGIPYSIEPTPSRTGSEADTFYKTGSGAATALVSVPSRYMHSPNEMVDLTDVEHTIRLIAAFVSSVQSEREFVPE